MGNTAFQKLPVPVKVFIFDEGVQGYVETGDGVRHTFASHAEPGVTAESKLDLCWKPEVATKYKTIAARALASYRKEKRKGEFEVNLVAQDTE